MFHVNVGSGDVKLEICSFYNGRRKLCEHFNRSVVETVFTWKCQSRWLYNLRHRKSVPKRRPLPVLPSLHTRPRHDPLQCKHRPQCNRFIQWESFNEAKCEITSPFQFKVTFTADNNSGKIFGQTTEKPFMTPYSSIRATVTFSYYFGCNTEEPPGVKGTKTMSSVIEKMLDSSTLTFTSLSEIVADTNASLIIKFKPNPVFQHQGRVQINVPGWYITERATQFSPAVSS